MHFSIYVHVAGTMHSVLIKGGVPISGVVCTLLCVHVATNCRDCVCIVS